MGFYRGFLTFRHILHILDFPLGSHFRTEISRHPRGFLWEEEAVKTAQNGQNWSFLLSFLHFSDQKRSVFQAGFLLILPKTGGSLCAELLTFFNIRGEDSAQSCPHSSQRMRRVCATLPTFLPKTDRKGGIFLPKTDRKGGI